MDRTALLRRLAVPVRKMRSNKLRKITLMLALSVVRSVSLTLLISIGAAFAQDQSAPAPPCHVGQKLQFRYDDGRSFTREITAHENYLCVVKTANTSYYDKDWLLVKLVEPTGQTIGIANPHAPGDRREMAAFSADCR